MDLWSIASEVIIFMEYLTNEIKMNNIKTETNQLIQVLAGFACLSAEHFSNTRIRFFE